MSGKVIVLVGPTASGKSELAVRLAGRFNGEVVSADSRQVYRGFDIGSGKVSRDGIKNGELRIEKEFYHQGIRHHLIDVASPRRIFTAAEYQKLGRRAIQDALKRGKLPIICGGTGFYLDTLLYDPLFPVVPPQPEIRMRLQKKATEELFLELQRLDPERAATVDPKNRRRLIRALEIVFATGASVPPRTSRNIWTSDVQILKIGIQRGREELGRLIHSRLLLRLREGMIEEVRRLHERGLSWRRMEELGLEYRYVSRYLRGLITEEEMITTLETKIRQYAKRQMTWFKRDKEIHWIDSPKSAERLALQFLKKWGRAKCTPDCPQ